MNKIFVLSAYVFPNLEDKISEDQLALPDQITDINFDKYFSSYSKAKSQMVKLSKEKGSNYFLYNIKSKDLDTNKTGLNEYYDSKLYIISSINNDEPFLGIKDKSNKYQIGDWVLFVEHQTVKLGIIGAIPPTESEVKAKNLTHLDDYDNCYYILESSNDSSDTFPHSHIKEGFIAEIIPKSITHQFLSEKALKQIETNYNTYIKKNNS